MNTEDRLKCAGIITKGAAPDLEYAPKGTMQAIVDAEADTQAAIDAALESALQDAKWETMHNPSPEFERGMNMVIRVLNNHIGTNPLKEV